MVHLPDANGLLGKRPHELSGGMRQRVMIAAALAQRPAVLVADEPTTALDVSVQSEILAMLRELRQELGMSLILVSHDIAVVEEVCDDILVMYAGATVEWGPHAATSDSPLHPYTRALLSSRIDLADPNEELSAIEGEPPLAGSWPSGCRFRTRCPVVQSDCADGGQPPLRDFGGRLSACLHTEVEVAHVG
jgi:oligopeptide/dipeptide ABC transporter ATP-binding protein